MTADDFEQEGFFAVEYAAKTYDPARGAFTTWLSQAMRRQISLAMSNGHRRSFADSDGNIHTTSADPLNHCSSLDINGRLQRLYCVPQREKQRKPPGFRNRPCAVISKIRRFWKSTANAAMNRWKQLAPKLKAHCRPLLNG